MYIPQESMPCNRITKVQQETIGVYELHYHTSLGFVISRLRPKQNGCLYFSPNTSTWHYCSHTFGVHQCWSKDYFYLMTNFKNQYPEIVDFVIRYP